MRLIDIRYTPSASVEYTREDVDTLARCARAHYDGTCKALVKPCGLLDMMLGHLNTGGEPASIILSFAEVDILAKTTERDDGNLHTKLVNILFEMRSKD